jgi:hypothetical protein
MPVIYVSHTLLQQKPVVAVSGESGRSTFLTAKGFDIHPGFKDLLGGVNNVFQSLRPGHVIHTLRFFFFQIPMVRGVTSDLHGRTIARIYRRLAMVQTEASLSNRM